MTPGAWHHSQVSLAKSFDDYARLALLEVVDQLEGVFRK
jgi:hypothetical protein